MQCCELRCFAWGWEQGLVVLCEVTASVISGVKAALGSFSSLSILPLLQHSRSAVSTVLADLQG